MSAIKEYALSLEESQALAIGTENPGSAFRLGLLLAANLVLDTRGQYTNRLDAEGSGAWNALREAFDAIEQAYCYLRDV